MIREIYFKKHVRLTGRKLNLGFKQRIIQAEYTELGAIIQYSAQDQLRNKISMIDISTNWVTIIEPQRGIPLEKYEQVIPEEDREKITIHTQDESGLINKLENMYNYSLSIEENADLTRRVMDLTKDMV